jgi:hypothetical protein
MWHSPGVPFSNNGFLTPVAHARLAALIRRRKPPSWLALAEWRGKREAGGAPAGAPPETRQVRVTKRAPSLPGRAPHLSRLRRLILLGVPASAASRGWSRVGARLPCQDQWSVTYLYDGSAGMGRPSRDQFVIFIEPGVHMSCRLCCARLHLIVVGSAHAQPTLSERSARSMRAVVRP